MSGVQRQQDLHGDYAHPAHLTKNDSEINHTTAQRIVDGAIKKVRIEPADLTSREYWCLDCNAKVTRVPDKDHELGHALGCEHAIGVDA
jgi:hypothetical protein